MRRSWLLIFGTLLVATASILPLATYAERGPNETNLQGSLLTDRAVIESSTIENLQPIYTFSGHSEDVTEIAISPDNTRVASGSADGELRIWAIETGELLFNLQAHPYAITGLAWSPDGSVLASSTNDRFVKLWDAQSFELLRTVEARLLDYVMQVRFTPDGNFLVLAGPECIVILRDVETGTLFKTYNQRYCQPRSGGSVYSWGIDFDEADDEIILAFSQPACNCGSIESWELDVIASSELIYGFNLPVKDLALAPNGQDIAIAMVGTSFIRIIDKNTIYPLRDLTGHMFRVNSLDYSADGELLASASNDQRIGLWDPASGELLRLIHGHSDAVTRVRFSPDDTFLVSASKDNLVIVWGVGSEG